MQKEKIGFFKVIKKEFLISIALIGVIVLITLLWGWLSSIHYYGTMPVEYEIGEYQQGSSISFVCPKLTYFNFAIRTVYVGDVSGTLNIYDKDLRHCYSEKFLFRKGDIATYGEKMRLSGIFMIMDTFCPNYESQFVIVLKPNDTYVVTLSLDNDNSDSSFKLFIVGSTYRKFLQDLPKSVRP